MKLVKILISTNFLSILNRGRFGPLKEFKPSILLEFDDKNTTQFGYKRDDIVELLKTYGYTTFQMFGHSDLFASTL